jgi:hypothetical protein
MSTELIWTCDGCGAKASMSPNSSSGDDWKRISVKLDGFKGYPVGAEYNAEAHYELCPGCLSNLVHQANPRLWVRATPPPREGSDYQKEAVSL